MSKDRLQSIGRWRLEYALAIVCLAASLLGAGIVFFGDLAGGGPPRQVILHTVGGSITSLTQTRTVGDFLHEAGIQYGPNDLIDPSPSTPVSPGLVVSYTPAVKVLISDAGKPPVEYMFPGNTVCDLLSGVGIDIGPLDRVVPHPSTPLEDGMEVEITRVQVLDMTREREIDPPLAVEADPDLPRGRIEEIEAGSPGLAEDITRVYYRNGQETLRLDLGSRVLIEPTRRVTRVGTRAVPDLASRDGTGARNVMNMIATGYDPGPRSCGASADGLTATGRVAQRGVCAVDPNVIRLGTRLWIEGYGDAIACDTGGAIKGNRIDLCFDTYDEALAYGRRRVLVYILD
jgi:3D (Asp-Asp-Asp) domain-containing protein